MTPSLSTELLRAALSAPNGTPGAAARRQPGIPLGVLMALLLLSGVAAPVGRDTSDAAMPDDAARSSRPPGARVHNRLADALSPYLQSHGDDPVDWYPWGPEALRRAQQEDKPIFLSVGYSACYWCHVMQREVFSDPEIAALMNRWFINVQVDREERPDVDQVYMTAAHLLSGAAGWPNSVFLTPDTQPFFAGTYFPLTQTNGTPGFPQVLQEMHQAWQVRRAEVLKVAARVTAALRELEGGQQAPPLAPDSVLVHRALAAVQGRYDAAHGGFDGPPKFPPFVGLGLLLASPGWADDPRYSGMVNHTLQAMARGGLHDQVGGGLHRYAVDAAWRLPHFEKMLCTQAQAVQVYLRAYQATGREEWRRTAVGILGFVEREMTAASGAMYTALAAHAAGVEGDYYHWSDAELEAVLGEDVRIFQQVYDLGGEAGGGSGVLFAHTSIEEAAAELGMPQAELQGRLRAMLDRLLHERNQRPRPHLDDKVLAAWNGMMISSLALAREVTGEEQYGRTAARTAGFLLERMRTADRGLLRVYRQGTARRPAYLEDYVFVAQGLLDLHRASAEARWLQAAQELVEQMMARFWDPRHGGFFLAEAGGELLVRSKDGQDGALPAANAVAVHVLLDLATLTGEREYLRTAQRVLYAFGGAMHARPSAYTQMIGAAARYLREFAGQGGPAAGGGQEGGWAAAPDSLVEAHAGVSPARLVPGQQFEVGVQVRIRPGWHIAASPSSSQWAIPTSLAVETELPVALLPVRYPSGTPMLVAAMGETLRVYSDSVSLRVAGQLSRHAVAGQEGQVWVYLRYQACDTVHCLPAAEVRQGLRLHVGP